jgi:predicted transcriptional regulator
MASKRKIDPEDLDPAFVAAIEEGRADIAAGRTISHERIRAWLLSWGTPNELPPPE